MTTLRGTVLLLLFAVACGPEPLEADRASSHAGALVAEPEKEVKVKLNDDLSAVTRLVLPRLTEAYGAEDMDLDDLVLLNATQADLQGEEKSEGSVAQGQMRMFGPYHVARGSRLEVKMTDSHGDADLYVREDAQPTTGSWDCRPYLSGEKEECSLAGPGDFWVAVRGYEAADYELTVDYGGASPFVETVMDILLACHKDHRLVAKLENQHVDMPVGPNTFDASFVDAEGTGAAVDVDGELPGFRYTGTFTVRWPKDSSLLCVLASDYSVNIPVTVEGLTLGARATLDVGENGKLKLTKLAVSRFSVHSATFDSGLLNFVTNGVLAFADFIASTFQLIAESVEAVADPQLGVNLQPTNGVCSSPGAAANATLCLEAALSACLVSESFPGCYGRTGPVGMLRDAIEDALEGAAPNPVAIKGWARGVQYRFRATPTFTSATSVPNKDLARFNAALAVTSTAATASCASRLTRGVVTSTEGTFDRLGDLDVVVPYNTVNDVLYELARQGVFCMPISGLPFGVTLVPDGAIKVYKTVTMVQVGSPAPPPTLTTELPIALSAAPGVTGTARLTLLIEWKPTIGCKKMLTLTPVRARYTGLTGAFELLGRSYDVGAIPGFTTALTTAITGLPGVIGPQPLGTTVYDLAGLDDLYVHLTTFALDANEMAFGLDLSTSPGFGCFVMESSTTVELGTLTHGTSGSTGAVVTSGTYAMDPFYYGAQGANDFELLPSVPPVLDPLRPLP